MRHWAVVPAAGVGARFGAALPKQYQRLLGKTVLEHCLERLAKLSPASSIVALHPSDTHWQSLGIFNSGSVRRVEGGATRAESVLVALQAIAGDANEDDWVLVHDAARPCVTQADLIKLIAAVADTSVGGLLASPVSATLKRATLVAGTAAVDCTVDRRQLWQAATPQMFRYGLLRAALQQCIEQGFNVTDDAQAVELYGEPALLVRGREDNIKITGPADLALAEAIMIAQQNER